MIEIKFEGDWRKTKRFLGVLPITVRRAAEEGQRKAAETLVKVVVGHLKKQDLGWEPKSDEGHSNDERILIDSGTYLRSIKAWKNRSGYNVGVPGNTFSPKGERVADYAIYNEFGFGKGPARPLWGPSIQEMGGAKGVQQIIYNTILKQVTKAMMAS